MTTFAEEVYKEVFGAAIGDTRWLGDHLYRKSLRSYGSETVWVAPNGHTLTNVAMYEATIR